MLTSWVEFMLRFDFILKQSSVIDRSEGVLDSATFLTISKYMNSYLVLKYVSFICLVAYRRQIFEQLFCLLF